MARPSFASAWAFAALLVTAVAALDDDYNYCQARSPPVGAYDPIAGARLLSLQIVTRHGDRAPNSILPFENVTWVCAPDEARTQASDTGLWTLKHAWIPEDHPFRATIWGGDCEPGQLTHAGAKMERMLGAVVRGIYVDTVHFLPPVLEDTRVVAVRSTAVWRTQQSASNFLAGLYPPEFRGRGASPITIRNFPDAIETMTGNANLCPRLARLFAAQAASDEYRAMMDAHKDLLASLANITRTSSLPEWASSFDHYVDQFHARLCHGMPLPCAKDDPTACVTRDMAESAIAVRDWEYVFNNYKFRRTDVARAGVGSFFGEIVRNMRKAAESDANVPAEGGPLLHLYSGHDGTLAALLGALNVGGWRHPPYASNMVFEVWRRAGVPAGDVRGHVVRVMYNGAWLSPFDGASQGAEGMSLERFASEAAAVVPEDYRAECMNTDI